MNETHLCGGDCSCTAKGEIAITAGTNQEG